MVVPIADLSELASPGTPAFLPSIVSHALSRCPSFPIDTIVLQSILICLVAGKKHLLLRTQDEDIAHVAKLTALTLAWIFSYSTNRLKVRPQWRTTSSFLRALFSSSTSSASGAESANGSAGTHPDRQRRRLPSGSARFFPSVRTKSKPNTKQTRSPHFTRSSSSPAALTTLPTYPQTPAFDELSRSPTSPSVLAYDRRLSFAHIRDHDSSHQEAYTASTPEALVLSGLEHATPACQRALLQVLINKTIAIEDNADTQEKGEPSDEEPNEMWNLPDPFFMVYVCALDPRERPKIHRSLLDQFAMSATVSLQPATRHGLRQFTHRTPSPTPTSSSPVLPAAASGFRSPALPPNLLPALRRLHERTYVAPELSLYALDLFSAARHHHQLDGTFVTARARNDLDALARAARVIGRDLTGVELIRGPAALGEPNGAGSHTRRGGSTEISRGGDVHDNPLDHGSDVFKRSRSSGDGDSYCDMTLDVSEADVARTVPRVLSHRLRVRDGPEDELLGSILYGAVKGGETGVQEVERGTVKDILVRILSEV